MAERIFKGTGRRKASIAQVVMVPGKGNITVNGRDVREFFPYETNIMDLMQPLVATNNEKTFDITVKVNGEILYKGMYIKKYVRDGLYSFTTLEG